MAKRKYKNGMSTLDIVAITLLIAGGLNWGLVAFFNFDLVNWLSMGISAVDTGIKAIVGLSSVYSIFSFLK